MPTSKSMYDDGQYDVSPEEARRVKERAKIRAEYRREFLRQTLNPANFSEHGPGHLFDPVMQRWIALRAQYYPFFKPTSKNIWIPILIVGTCWAYGHLIVTTRSWDEAKRRRGEVSYRDREFKFLH